jgi:hypothetical protein
VKSGTSWPMPLKNVFIRFVRVLSHTKMVLCPVRASVFGKSLNVLRQQLRGAENPTLSAMHLPPRMSRFGSTDF